ncbi:Copia protein [Durusdinium trenchii]|uniref:Copia protein n=1 Tax=Durusdinium trenchii TaxID=1381693 RepID=A0ABP0S567_9DINO
MRDDWRLPNASRGMPFHWIGTTTFILRTDRRQPAPAMTTPPIGEATGEDQPMDQDPTTNAQEASQQDGTGTTGADSRGQTPESPPMAAETTRPPASSIGEEPEPPPSVIEQEIIAPVPEHQRALYHAPETRETFQQQRARVDRQETLSFYTPSTTGRIRYGPNREVFENRRSTTSPYNKPPAPDPETALLQATYEADMAKADATTLPPGWRLENGYLTLEDTRDEWIFKDDKLIRRHYLPRNHYFDPAEQDAGCPLPLHYLSKDRHTLGSDSLNQYDRWKQKKNTYRQQAWTGSTIFKIMPAYRHLARQIFYNVSNGHQSYKETETAEQAYNAQQPPRPKNMKARERVTRFGAVVHPLDPCLFMVYDYDAPEDQWLDQPDDNGNTVRQPPLLGLFGLHVDDILGCGNMDNASFQKFIKQMKQTFTFRTWEQDSDIEYCGAKIQRINQHHYELQHTSYLAKQKPISFKDTNNNANSDQPMTEKQRTMLRGLVGALQWPATQSSPHLQASVSQLAGLTSKATTSTLREANKCLRFAKQHSDVGLKFQRIGRPEDLTLIAYSDAAFASRHDLTSQGGQLILLVHHSVTTGQEGSYHIVD